MLNVDPQIKVFINTFVLDASDHGSPQKVFCGAHTLKVLEVRQHRDRTDHMFVVEGVSACERAFAASSPFSASAVFDAFCVAAAAFSNCRTKVSASLAFTPPYRVLSRSC